MSASMPPGDAATPQDAAAAEGADPRRERWEQLAMWPLSVAAVAFLIGYAWPILEPTMRGRDLWACRTVVTLTWLLFVVDYVVRLTLTRRKARFVRRHPLDLAVVLVPALRPLQLVRVVQILDRRAGSAFRGKVAVYVGTAVVVVVAIGSLAVLDAERGVPGARITSFGDAVWWAMTTITTVGYGDLYPVTTTGRVVAAGLMLAGIAVLGVVTASISSWLIEHVEDIEEDDQQVTRGDLRALREEVAALREALDRSEGSGQTSN